MRVGETRGWGGGEMGRRGANGNRKPDVNY